VTLEEIEQEVVDGFNQATGQKTSIEQSRSMIHRKIAIVLSQLDTMAAWPFAIEDFSVSIPANSGSALVSNFDIFKPVSCKATFGTTTDKPLIFLEITDFDIKSANYVGSTNGDPDYYSLAGKNIYVGPGLLAEATTVSGRYQRKLILADISSLPAQMIIDGTLKRMLKKGTPEDIAARTEWNMGKGDMKRSMTKATEERRSIKRLDPRIAANNRYENSL
jgi:hypothetical protein